ncbi:MAG: hypothetical protein KIG50_00025 [Lachnospiraceae bacterium]|nr:hypothetical protein [Lachnospiraceae bacterium]
MNIGMLLLIIVGSAVAVFTTGYLVVSIFAVIGYKIVRKIRYGISMFN